MEKADYFVRRGNDERGPTTAARLRELAAHGKLSQDDVIRRGENGDWFRAGDIPGLFDSTCGADGDGELLRDPLVNLAAQAAGTVGKAAGVVGKAALQIGNAAKGVIARRLQERSLPPAIQSPIKLPEPSEVIVPAEPMLLIEAPVDDEITLCPFCNETIKKAAKKCKHCGEILDVVLRQIHQKSAEPAPAVAARAPVIRITNVNTATPTVHANSTNVNAATAVATTANNGRRVKRWSRFVAALLSLLIPGLGQLYKGQPIRGVLWFFLVAAAYTAGIPGFVLHVCCILGATMGDPYR